MTAYKGVGCLHYSYTVVVVSHSTNVCIDNRISTGFAVMHAARTITTSITCSLHCRIVAPTSEIWHTAFLHRTAKADIHSTRHLVFVIDFSAFS